MDKNILKIAKLYVTSLSGKYKLKQAYIFGSHARGNASKHSDIDIALILDTKKNLFDATVDLMKLRRDFDLRIEPHPFREKEFMIDSDPLVNEVLKHGFPIKIK